MTWKVMQKNYVLDGYSICDSSASQMFTMFDYRKQMITYFVRCIIYFTVQFKDIKKFIHENAEIIQALNGMEPYGWYVIFKKISGPKIQIVSHNLDICRYFFGCQLFHHKSPVSTHIFNLILLFFTRRYTRMRMRTANTNFNSTNFNLEIYFSREMFPKNQFLCGEKLPLFPQNSQRFVFDKFHFLAIRIFIMNKIRRITSSPILILI